MTDEFVAIGREQSAHADIVARGFTRRPLPLDSGIARGLAELARAAWDMPRDQYYETGDRFRSLNRFKAEIVAGGVRIRRCDDSEPYVQLEKYNPSLPGTKREYQPLPEAVANTAGIRRLMAYHLMYLPLSETGARYSVNLHVLRFAAAPGRHESAGTSQGWREVPGDASARAQRRHGRRGGHHRQSAPGDGPLYDARDGRVLRL
jgi:hypothetical protein